MEEINKLKKENEILKKEIENLYKDWLYDSKRYQDLKIQHKSLIKILEDNKIKYIE